MECLASWHAHYLYLMIPKDATGDDMRVFESIVGRLGNGIEKGNGSSEKGTCVCLGVAFGG